MTEMKESRLPFLLNKRTLVADCSNQKIGVVQFFFRSSAMGYFLWKKVLSRLLAELYFFWCSSDMSYFMERKYSYRFLAPFFSIKGFCDARE